MNETDKKSCILCGTTDQVQGVDFSGMEQVMRARFQIAEDEAEELMKPLGICAQCRALPEDEQHALFTANFRIAYLADLIETGIAPLAAHEYAVVIFPEEPEELSDFLRDPPPAPRKHGEPCSRCGSAENTGGCCCGDSFCGNCTDRHFTEDDPDFCPVLREHSERPLI